MHTLIQRGLDQTKSLWSDITIGYRWVARLQQILANPDQLSGAQVRHRLAGLIGSMKRWQPQLSDLSPFVDHFCKVTHSYWSGLFHCYDVPNLPRTNNDLEHLFGSYRHLERRITGHKSSKGAIVVYGAARLIAAIATQNRTFTVHDLASVDYEQCRKLRQQIQRRQTKRVLQRRFRADPESYLSQLESDVLNLILPS